MTSRFYCPHFSLCRSSIMHPHSGQPRMRPSAQPSREPTNQPTRQPVSNPTSQPTQQPTRQPTRQPSREPTMQPSRQPFAPPTSQPSRQPASRPTKKPIPSPSGTVQTKSNTQSLFHTTMLLKPCYSQGLLIVGNLFFLAYMEIINAITLCFVDLLFFFFFCLLDMINIFTSISII